MESLARRFELPDRCFNRARNFEVIAEQKIILRERTNPLLTSPPPSGSKYLRAPRWEKEFRNHLPLTLLKSDGNQIDNSTCSGLADRCRPGIELSPLLIDTQAKVVRLRGVPGYIR